MQGKKHIHNWKRKKSLCKRKKWTDVGVFCISAHVSFFLPFCYHDVFLHHSVLCFAPLPQTNDLHKQVDSRLGDAGLGFLWVCHASLCFLSPQLQNENKETPLPDLGGCESLLPNISKWFEQLWENTLGKVWIVNSASCFPPSYPFICLAFYSSPFFTSSSSSFLPTIHCVATVFELNQVGKKLTVLTCPCRGERIPPAPAVDVVRKKLELLLDDHSLCYINQHLFSGPVTKRI